MEAEHNIQLGLYDASWKEQITSSTREELEKKMHLVPVQNLEQRIPGETELEAEMEIHQFGTVDQYMKLSDTYFKDWVAG